MNRQMLKPCPFCGSSDIDAAFAKWGDGAVSPGCMSCGATANTQSDWNDRASPQSSADSAEAGIACKNCRHRGSHLAWRCDACGFEVKRPLPTEPQPASKSEAIAWECTDERYSYRYIKGIVTTSTNTLKAWREEGIAFADLVRRSQAESAMAGKEPSASVRLVNELAAWLVALEDAAMYEPVPDSLVQHGRMYIHGALTEKHSGDCTNECHTCVVCSGSDHIAKAKQILAAMHLAQPQAALCDDCPPDGYPTDKTRCAPCPRRAPHCQAESALGREALWHTIAKHIACKKDCQARPSGCGCARDAANTIIRAMTAISPQHQGASNE